MGVVSTIFCPRKFENRAGRYFAQLPPPPPPLEQKNGKSLVTIIFSPFFSFFFFFFWLGGGGGGSRARCPPVSTPVFRIWRHLNSHAFQKIFFSDVPPHLHNNNENATQNSTFSLSICDCVIFIMFGFGKGYGPWSPRAFKESCLRCFVIL